MGLLGVFCSRFSLGVVPESLGFAPASFLRCGYLVPINSCGGLGFFIVALSDCWLVAAAELAEQRFDCCEGRFFLGVRAFAGFICLAAPVEVIACSFVFVIF